MYGDEPGKVLEWDYGQVDGDEDEQVDRILKYVRSLQAFSYKVGPAVVIEDFDIEHHNRTSDQELLSPVRIAAKLLYGQHIGRAGDARMVLQGRTMAKSTATDERLKVWGLYISGQEHARDACRHAITAVRRARQNKAIRDQLWYDPQTMWVPGASSRRSEEDVA